MCNKTLVTETPEFWKIYQMSLKGFDLEIFCKSAMETLLWCFNDTGITVALCRILFSIFRFDKKLYWKPTGKLSKSCCPEHSDTTVNMFAVENTELSLSCSFQEEARRVALKQRAEQNVHTETLGWEEEEEGTCQTSYRTFFSM